MDEANGEYFMWAAHDDQWMPMFIDKMINMLIENSNAVCAISKVKFSDGILSNATFPITGNPRQRLRAFLKDPGDNSRFYGIYRINTLKKVFYSRSNWNFHAADWLIVALIAIEGDILEGSDVLMLREQAEKDKYLKAALVDNKNVITSCFPLLIFSFYLLKNKEAWTIESLISLIKRNIYAHVRISSFCNSKISYFYKTILHIVIN